MNNYKTIKIIDTDSDQGKEFISNVNKMAIDLFKAPNTNEKSRQFKQLTVEEVDKYGFLKQVTGDVMGKNMKLSRIFLGRYRRRGGCTYSSEFIDTETNEQKPFFRVVLHLGHSEVYYLSCYSADKKRDIKDYPIALTEGEGLIYSTYLGEYPELT